MNQYQVMPAHAGDIEKITAIFAAARAFMAEQGNPQWSDGYPYPEVISRRVECGQFFKLTCGGDIAAVFSVLVSDDDYDNCRDIWLTEEGRYLAVHTVAVNPAYRGSGCARAVFAAAVDMARSLEKLSLRIDTHAKNVPMRSLLLSEGFSERGSILLYGNQPRIAYEKLI